MMRFLAGLLLAFAMALPAPVLAQGPGMPARWTAGDIVWPAPKKIPVGPLMNYGYQDDVLLPVPITAPANAKAGDKITLKAQVSLLVCAEVCVPEDDALRPP